MKYRIFHITLFLLLANCMQSQWFPTMHRKGSVFGGWGWNRSAYTQSDIHFRGDNYNFTLLNVEAKDRQTKFNAETYFGLKTLTIPQTNLKLGYFINDHIAITVGYDHMKYVMVQNQTVSFEGAIEDDLYMSMVENNTVKLTPQFLVFEHTDGLNYLLSEIEYYQGIHSGNFLDISGFIGLGAGALMPKSNVKLMGYPRNDEFHFAGYGANTKLGVELLFGNHFYVRGECKAGYIHMPSIVTRHESISDRASQRFGFAAIDMMFGFNITPRKNKTNNNESIVPSAG